MAEKKLTILMRPAGGTPLTIMMAVGAQENLGDLLERIVCLTGADKKKLTVFDGALPLQVSTLVLPHGKRITIEMEAIPNAGGPPQPTDPRAIWPETAGASRPYDPRPEETPSNLQTEYECRRLDLDGRVYGMLIRDIKAPDEAGLFSAVAFCLSSEAGCVYNNYSADYRDIIAQTVAADTAGRYPDSVLGRPRAEYLDWIKRIDSPVGTPEITILAQKFKVAIWLFDLESIRVKYFCWPNWGFTRRIYLFYADSKYYPIYFKEPNKRDIQAIFAIDDDGLMLARVRELSVGARLSPKMIDLRRFNLKCRTCGELFKRFSEAHTHAMVTPHKKYNYINHNNPR